jgi:hypothetical protein
MENIFHRLKQLDWSKFEELCFQLLQARFPMLKLHRIEGSSGDEGIDIFSGKIEGEHTVWQVKFFTEKIGKTQRGSIRESFKRVISNNPPKRWVLCLPINLDVSTFRWLQKLGKSYGSTVEIDAYAASDITRDLIHYRSLKEHFFPDIHNEDLFRAVLKQARGLTDGEAAAFTEDNIQEFLKDLQNKEPRLGFQVVFTRDVNPEARPIGAIGSLSLGNRTVYLFPRDIQALQTDPLRMSLAFTPQAHEKLARMYRFGDEVTFTKDEVTVVKNPLPTILPQLGQTDGFEIRFGRRRLAHILRAKCEVIANDEAVIFEYVEFEDEKVGQEELVLVSKEARLGFIVRLVLHKAGQPGTITFHYLLAGCSPSAALKLFKSIQLMRKGAQFRITDLEIGKQIAVGMAEIETVAGWENELVSFLEKLERIAHHFGTELRLPSSELLESDLETVDILDHLCQGGTVNVTDASAKLVKSEENSSLILDYAGKEQEFTFIFKSSNHEPVPKIFGKTLDIGLVEISSERVRIKNGRQIAEAFKKAKIGETVPIQFEFPKGGKLRLAKDTV